MRDAINQEVKFDDQPSPFEMSSIVTGDTRSFSNQWVQFVPTNSVLNIGRGLSFENVSTGKQVFISDEPFWVSGKQAFKLLSTGVNDSFPVYVYTANRREFLSRLHPRHAAENSVLGTPVYFASFQTPVQPGASHAYLGADLIWAVASRQTAPNGLPFGWGASGAAAPYVGRYYDVEISVDITAGSGGTNIYYCPAIIQAGGLTTSEILISPTAPVTNPTVQLTIGDGPYSKTDFSVSAGAGYHSMSTVKASRGWTIGFQNVFGGVVIKGFMTVYRKGC